MTKTYEECCKEVGFNQSVCTPPEQVKHWYAYVDGKAIRCETSVEAKKYKLNELVIDPESKLAAIKFWDDRRQLEEKALVLFRKSIREEHSDMSDALFDHCYNAAKERSRSADHDEIPDNFTYFADFAKIAIKLKK